MSSRNEINMAGVLVYVLSENGEDRFVAAEIRLESQGRRRILGAARLMVENGSSGVFIMILNGRDLPAQKTCNIPRDGSYTITRNLRDCRERLCILATSEKS